MIKKSMFATAVAVILAIPVFSFAAGIIDSTVTVVSSVPAVCYPFSRSLSVGISGKDVVALQNYLKAQGYFNATATGYFGVITKAAVGNWQAQNNVVARDGAGNGIFGPLSRGSFIRLCSGNDTGSGGGNGGGSNGSSTPSAPSFSANPQSGSAPLTVQFVASAPQGTALGSAINFGDGTSGSLGYVPVCSDCNAEGIASHTYVAAGTYTAMLTSGACSCPVNGICNCPSIQILATTSVVVGLASTSTTATASSSIEQLNAPGTVTLSLGGIAEIRNESSYFTLQSLGASSATIQITPVGCWNSFPSDPRPRIVCMIALIPTPPQTLAVGQTYDANNYSITLVQLTSSTATFDVK